MQTGFEIHERVLAHAACDALAPPSTSRAGQRHLMRNATVADVARQPELMSIARRVVGPGAVPYRATLFQKSGANNWLVTWHQDTALPVEQRFDAAGARLRSLGASARHPPSSSPAAIEGGWGPWSIKEGIHYAHAPTWALERIVALRLHLDPSTADNGPLRVIAGSHRLGVLTDDEVAVVARESRAEECCVGKGGVLVMRPLLIHASSKARRDASRRVLHIEYAASLDLAPGIRLAIA